MERSRDVSMQQAPNEFREGRYAQAIAGLEQFLTDYPDSDQADNVQYWLGKPYCPGGDNEAAKKVFIRLGMRYSKGKRMPDTLLRLGYIYEKQDKLKRAKEILQKP
ncbi:MAG: hypothetical protein CSA09_03365 [Candidatus Contendobacter odensis]|uniref:Tol-pal system protein YbgF n=1 Tax=Candidatus Contendibacter odensensis TaxID=1400860 RepID=A0A2G6PEX9_9GAMM|nr:MAG: hypothetical protein CSA09_03365 [Candidatus Contendobacter odensis]